MIKGFVFFLRQGWKYDKKYVVWLFLLQIVKSISPIAGALLPKLVIDELTGMQRVSNLFLYTLVFSGWICISNALTCFLDRDCFTHRCRVDAAFGFEMHERLALADYENMESPGFIDMQEKAKKFLTCDDHGFGYLLDCGVGILGQIITISGLVVMLSTMDLWFVLFFAGLAMTASLVESKAIKKAMSLSMEVVKHSRRWVYYTELFERAQYGKEIRINSMMKWLLDREKKVVSKANDNIALQNNGYIASGVKRAVLTLIQQLAAYGVLVWKVIFGSLSIGSFSMCISAVTSFADAMRTLMDRMTEIRAYDLYYERLDEYMHIPQRMRNGRRLPVPDQKHRFEFCDVGFRYQGAENWALRHVNLLIEPGQRLAIVGENGSGKSTFVKLLCRLYAPTEGTILMDGIDIQEYDYDQYLKVFSTLFQDFQLFDCSICDNILLGKPMDANLLNQIIEQVGLCQKISELPHGLNTTVGRKFDEEGFLPSGGEAQKIVLARALYKNSPVFILDEPTAAMDPRAEYELYQSFDSLVVQKTTIYISHRLSVCRFCDQIAVFHQGKLVEYGTHERLMADSARYAELYSMQAQYYTES